MTGGLPRRRLIAAGAGVAARVAAGVAAGGGLSAALGGCADQEPPRRSVITIGTGNPTDVFYQVGGGYADAITRHVDGYEGLVAATAGSTDNLLRLDAGDIDVALTFADVAADAVRGLGVFASVSPRLRALAAIYRSYAHVIARIGAGIRSVADLRNRRVSTGERNSGTEFLAERLLRAAGLDPDRDIERIRLSLPATTRALAGGSLDAMFWSAGLPTVGITALLSTAGERIRFLPVEPLLPGLAEIYPDTYVPGEIPAAVYELSEEVPTIAVNNLIVVNADMPDQLARDLTALVFDHQSELAAAHPEWAEVDKVRAAQTGAIPLHPGAHRYFSDTG